jgi:hypothetical protein
MDKEKIQQLHNELNELSENEEKNKERMLEIARVLVQIYLPNRSKNEDKKTDRLSK